MQIINTSSHALHLLMTNTIHTKLSLLVDGIRKPLYTKEMQYREFTFKYLYETEPACNKKKISVPCGSVIGRFHSILNKQLVLKLHCYYAH